MSCADHALPKAGPSLGSSRALLPLLCPPGLAKSATGGNNTAGRNFPSKEGILPHFSCSLLRACPLPGINILDFPMNHSQRSGISLEDGLGQASQPHPSRMHRDVSLTLAGDTPGTHRGQLLAFWSLALLAAQPPKS